MESKNKDNTVSTAGVCVSRALPVVQATADPSTPTSSQVGAAVSATGSTPATEHLPPFQGFSPEEGGGMNNGPSWAKLVEEEMMNLPPGPSSGELGAGESSEAMAPAGPAMDLRVREAQLAGAGGPEALGGKPVMSQGVQPGAEGPPAPKGKARRRKRKKDQWSPGNDPVAKKAGTVSHQPGGYAEVANRALRVCFVYEEDPFGEVLKEDAAAVKRQVTDLIRQGSYECAGPSQCLQAGFALGCLLISCANQQTVEFFKGLGIIEIPSGRKMRAHDFADVRGPKRVYAWVAEAPDDPKEVVRQIGLQNPGLDLGTWQAHYSRTNPDGARLMALTMSRLALEELRKRQFTLFYELGRLRFHEAARHK